MRTLDDIIRPHSQVVDTKLDEGEVVLLHLESKMYYSLNPTGERIWQGLKEGLTLTKSAGGSRKNLMWILMRLIRAF